MMQAPKRSRRAWFLSALMTIVLIAACGGPGTPQPPAAPSNVAAAPGPRYVTVSWLDNSTNETGFEVYRAVNDALQAQQAGEKIATVGADETSYVDLDVELQVDYTYSVVAINAAGSSDPAAAASGVSVPVGVDLMVGTTNRRWTEDSTGTSMIVYFVFPQAILDDQSDTFAVRVDGPPGWNSGGPINFACAWNGCNRSEGFVFLSLNSFTSVAGEYTATVTAGGQQYTASATLADTTFRFPRATDITITAATSSSVTASWTAPPGAGSTYVSLYEGEYVTWIAGAFVPAGTTSHTFDGLNLADGIYGFEVAPHNVDIGTYPVKVDPFGLSYDIELFGVGDFVSPECTAPDQVVDIPDASLQAVVRDQLGIPAGDITCADMALLDEVSARFAGIANLEGLQYALNLDLLDLDNNDVEDVSPLAGLVNLTNLNLNANEVTDVGPLAALTELRQLHLCCTTDDITDVTPLEGMVHLEGLNIANHDLGDAVLWPLLENFPNLTGLWIGSNQLTDFSALADHPNVVTLQLDAHVIADLSPVTSLTQLRYLEIRWADIADLTPLHSLTYLTGLDLTGNGFTNLDFLEDFTELSTLILRDNALTSLDPLVANLGLGSGDYVDVTDNALDLDDPEVQADIQTLLDRGVDLQY